MSEWVSECCGAAEVGASRDMGICPQCKEHCDYEDLDYDPTPYCSWCGAMVVDQCKCGPIAENH